MTDIVHLHVHSHYSLMDGLNTPLELFHAAKDLGQNAVAFTDHGTNAAHREAQKAAAELGMKAILGQEMYLSPTDRFDRREVKKRDDNTQLYNHVIVLAKNQAGLRNLNKLSELAWTEGFYHKPRIDKEILAEYRDGLIVLSGCLNGVISKAIEKNDPEGAEAWMDYFVTTFGSDFYVELQPDNPIEINRGLYQYAKQFGVTPTVTADCHFARPEDRWVEEALLILSTNPGSSKETYASTKNLEVFERYNALFPDRPISFEKLDLFIQGRGNMKPKLLAQGLDDERLYESTLEIADKIGDYPYHEGLNLLPVPKVDPMKRLRELCYQGLKKRGMADDPKAVERLEEELAVIEQLDHPIYFLLVRDMVTWAKQQDILVGPGRGSGAGSLINYSLGITNVNPLEYNLLFFRFINPERNDWPDIDTDFEDRRRKEVKDYLRRKFKNVANISTYSPFKDKGVIRDAARVYAVPLGDVNRALKGVENDPNSKDDYFDIFLKSEKGREFNAKYPEVMELAKRLRGKIRSVGMHAGGIVISREPIENYVPIETRPDPQDKVAGRVAVIAADMDAVADIGLLKIDALGLKTLSVISDTLKMVTERHGRKIDLYEIPLDDKRIYEQLSAGNTVGVFQAEATPYTKLLVNMGVSDFNDLVASNALVRPGAANTVGKIYINRKKGLEQTRYAHDILEPITRDTYGVIIYQEQVMLACTELAGMSMSDADRVRKIIGKKKDKKEFNAYRERFIEGATKHVPQVVAENLWHDFEAHAGYSFNKSHAVAYSLLSYWTAWLKVYYPLEFMFALLANEKGSDAKRAITTYLIEAKRLGLKIRLPHIERSELEFSIKDDAIYFGLVNIKGLAEISASRLIQKRPYTNYKELYEYVTAEKSGLTTRQLHSLNAIGAAAYPDNPRSGQEEYNYYEYLGIPKFNTVDWPWYIREIIRPLDEFDETEAFVVMAMVEKIKRGKGWSRVEIVDESGTAGVFHNEDSQIEPGQMYFILVASNRIVRYVPVDDVAKAIKEGTDDAFIKYLTTEQMNLTAGVYYVVRFDKRMTKARKMMGTLVIANREKEMRSVVCFSKEFPLAYTKAREGSNVSLSLGRLDDGGLVLRGVNSVEV